MAWTISKNGTKWEVVDPETDKVDSQHGTKKAAIARCEELAAQGPPDRVKKMSNGTTVNIRYKNKEGSQ